MAWALGTIYITINARAYMKAEVNISVQPTLQQLCWTFGFDWLVRIFSFIREYIEFKHECIAWKPNFKCAAKDVCHWKVNPWKKSDLHKIKNILHSYKHWMRIRKNRGLGVWSVLRQRWDTCFKITYLFEDTFVELYSI